MICYGCSGVNSYTQTWTVPASVTLIQAEVWGAGACGYYSPTSLGAGAGGYARGFLTVISGSAITLIIGEGGIETVSLLDGESSKISSTTGLIGATGGQANGLGGLPFGTNVGYGVQGGGGTLGTITYGQVNATDYRKMIKYPDGGTAYGAQPGGRGVVLVNRNGTYYYTVGTPQKGSFPGGGGGSTDISTPGVGGDGMIVLHW